MKTYSSATDSIADYVEHTFKPEDETLRWIRENARAQGLPDIHVGKMDGLHLEVLMRAINAKLIVEIGTLAGYSGVCLARGLASGGHLFTFEYEPRHAEVAEQSFNRAGLRDQVSIFVGAALDNLSKIESKGPFDAVFIDADKPTYPAYLDWSIKNLKVGGVILADNTFAMGEIPRHSSSTGRLGAIHSLNTTCATDPRLRSTIWPTSDGLTMAVKIKSN